MNKPLRLGIAGLGTVGAALIKILNERADKLETKAGRPITVACVSAKNRHKDRGIDLARFRWFDSAVELATCDEIDVFVELIGGEDGVAKESVEAALGAGKHVVTANKALLAHHGMDLARLAEDNNVALNYEAAVAGAIPIVKALRESLLGNEIERVFGILNGTCNYILTVMQKENRPFGEVLKEAQDAGYAEADPTFDIGGFDTAHKLAILSSLAFGTEISFDTIYLEGIESITPEDIRFADELGYRIKLLGVGLRTEFGIEQRVHPTMVPKHSAIAEVDGATNCVAVDGDAAGDILLVGAGAGGKPTASSVVSDIVDIARGKIAIPFITPVAQLEPYRKARMRAHEGGYYIRLKVFDRPGALASIATRMAEHRISLESIVQKQMPKANADNQEASDEKEPVTVVMITHETTEQAIRSALSVIENDGDIAKSPQMIRIERL